MKIGTMDSVIAGRGAQTGWTELYSICRDLGFSGQELGVGQNYGESELWTAEGRDGLKRAASENSVATPSICVHSYWNFSFAHSDPEIRNQAADIARGAAVAAVDMGASNILIPLTDSEGVPDAASRERWITGIGETAHAAVDAGVCFCLENVGRSFANAPEDIALIVDKVGSTGVGVYYDPGNAVYSGLDPLHGIEVLAGRIKSVHVKEVDGTYLGDGKVPWPEIIAALRGIGYDGWLILETDPTEDPVQAAARNLSYLLDIT